MSAHGMALDRWVLLAAALEKLGGRMEVDDSDLERLESRGEVVHTRLATGKSEYRLQIRSKEPPPSENSRKWKRPA